MLRNARIRFQNAGHFATTSARTITDATGFRGCARSSTLAESQTHTGGADFTVTGRKDQRNSGGLIPCGAAVFAGFGRPEQGAVLPVDENALIAAEPASAAAFDLVPSLAKRGDHVLGHLRFDAPRFRRGFRPGRRSARRCRRAAREPRRRPPARSCRSRSCSTSTCTCPCACMSPPITPKQNHGLPSLVTMAGMIVWNGRLCGSSRFRCVSSRANSSPRFCITKPTSPGTIQEPKPAKLL